MFRSSAQRLRRMPVVATIAVPIAMLALAAFALRSDAQEKKAEPAKEPPTAPGLYREFSGIIQLGNYGDRPKRTIRSASRSISTAIAAWNPWMTTSKPPEAPHIMGGTVYFAVFKNVGGAGDVFGTGMPGGMDRHFVPGDGDPHGHRPGRLRFSSPGYLREIPVLVPGRGCADWIREIN